MKSRIHIFPTFWSTGSCPREQEVEKFILEKRQSEEEELQVCDFLS